MKSKYSGSAAAASSQHSSGQQMKKGVTAVASSAHSYKH
jgi:hypothetical protein